MINIKDIKTGDCLLVSSNGFLSKAIQFFQKLTKKEGWEYNHAGMFWWCYDKLFVIESIKTGVAITPFDDYLDNTDDYDKLIVVKGLKDVCGAKIGSFMLNFCGRTRYDFWNLFFAQSVKILSLGKIWIGKRVKNEKRFICGEWVGFVWKEFGFEELQDVNVEKIAPIDIYNFKETIKIRIR